MFPEVSTQTSLKAPPVTILPVMAKLSVHCVTHGSTLNSSTAI